jgi:predicted nuclease of predicted toxin-antitoxin system
MKLLLDTCVWGGALADIQAAGHDAVWVGQWDEDPGDEEILARALAEGRVLVTLDKDFGELVFARRLPHGGVLRLVNFPARQQARACLHVLSLHGTDLEAGAMVTAEPGVLRIRLPDPTNGPSAP